MTLYTCECRKESKEISKASIVLRDKKCKKPLDLEGWQLYYDIW